MEDRLVSVIVTLKVSDNRSDKQICDDVALGLENYEKVQSVQVIDVHGRRITT